MTQTNVNIKKLKLLEKNPRRISKEAMKKLTASLKQDPSFLDSRPVLVNLVDGVYTVYGGNQRVRAAKKLRWKTIPCSVEENLDNDLMQARIIKDNKTYGEFDFDALGNEWDIDLLLDAGFTPEQLSFDPIDTAKDEDDSNLLEPKKDCDADTKLGDVYELNEHRLACGDSTSADVVEKLLAGATPILMVTDPPYGVNYDPDWRSKEGKAQKSSGKVQNDDQADWSEAFRLFTGSVAYVWCSSWHLPEVAILLSDCNYEMKSLIIWLKQHFTISRGNYHWKHEPCWYAVKKGCKHNWQGSRKETTVWEIPSLGNWSTINKKEIENDSTAHSTQKPLECMAKPVINNTALGESVYDPFIGSGTTLIACEQLGRTCYGIELSPAYCDIVVERWKSYMEKMMKPFKINKNGLEVE